MKLRGLVLLFFLVIYSIVVQAEKWNLGWDIGAGGGITSYTGDLNLSPLPRELGVNLGLLGRFSFNKYYAARMNLYGGNISGRYNPDRYDLPRMVGKRIEEFNHFIIGFDANLEVHFLPFVVNILSSKRNNDAFIAPYVTFGLGTLAASGGGIGLYIPMGAGVKVAVGSRLTVSGELRFLKQFQDGIDKYRNLPRENADFGIHNKDWVAMVSISCAYRIFFSVQRCAAYH